MNVKDLKSLFLAHPSIERLKDCLKQSNCSKIQINGLLGSSSTFAIASLFEKIRRTIVFVADDAESASYVHSDLLNLIGQKDLLYFPSSYKRSVLYDQIDNSNVIAKTDVLNRVNSNKSHIIVTYPEALIEKVITKENLDDRTLELKRGEQISIEFINDVLAEYGFTRVDFVYEPGQYSIRGCIVDIFSYSNDVPYRIDFFGEDVETIRTFDPMTQLSKEDIEQITIVPDIQEAVNETTTPFINYLPTDTILWANDWQYCFDKMDSVVQNTFEKYDKPDKDIFIKSLLSGKAMLELVANRLVIENRGSSYFVPDAVVEFHTSLQPTFNKNFELLGECMCENTAKGYSNFLFTDNFNQADRLHDIFKEINSKVKFEGLLISIHRGFFDHDLKLCLFTDHQIFERYHKHNAVKRVVSEEAMTLKDINNLQPGDFVVHIDHGIGEYRGLDRIEVNGKIQEAIRLVYRDQDVLYVSIHNLHKISKYKGKDGTPPNVHKLGSGVWQKTKERTKGKIKDIAKELIALYAERKSHQGFQFSPDSYLQTELEASFFYEDTPDQLKATKAVKRAMEAPTPMDMLVCGDVGFGKTEVAIRAAFKAVADSKQVAVLVPTTILALQHYKTFSSRLKDFPCKVEYISRLRTLKEQNEILKQVKNGEIDILIGTHKLVGKTVAFKDLGLLIIDEEQKFGVSIKEKLKQVKVNVDTLTLTATPIPRTLQFSLMGARDLSIINTPPPNRHPIVTEVHTFSEDVIRDAIVYEIERDGQVFVINNRIGNIYQLEALINRLCPGVRTIVGHGQMEGPKLEKIMLDFINGEYDVLIATTIIESGLDIPNANTIIINDAQTFGLSELHQLRGRVGRSNKKSYAYLLAPPENMLSEDARRRLKAIEEFSELGSGFNIAMQDLDIRGAGNLLGGEQSGFISDIGFETYQKILDEAMLELKENEYKEFYAKEASEQADKEGKPNPDELVYVSECQVDTDFELLFPTSYVANATERVKLYRSLDNVKNEEELQQYEKELVDRFGPMPDESKSLLDIVRLRQIAERFGIERIILKNGVMINYFVSNQESLFYQTTAFTQIINYVQSNPRTCKMQEKNDHLTLMFQNINNVAKAIHCLRCVAGEE